MPRQLEMLFLVLTLATSARAGELLFTNGSRVAGELVNEVLMISTGSDVVEVVPEQISVLTPDEIRLKDGRVIRGTVVGDRVKVRTALGELAVRLDELRMFRAGAPADAGADAPAPSPRVQSAPDQVAQGFKKIGQGVEEAATGVGSTIRLGAERLHDGAKAFGEAIWGAMKSAGEILQSVFAGSSD